MTLRTLLRAIAAMLPTWPHPINDFDPLEMIP